MKIFKTAMAMLQHEFERLGGYDRESQEQKLFLQGLGFQTRSNGINHLGQLSGGWRMRVELSTNFTSAVQTSLLLDEPSNHLDLQSVVWLGIFSPFL